MSKTRSPGAARRWLLRHCSAVLAPGAWAASAVDAERVYVSDEKGGNVVIVDPQTAAVLARIPVGKRPRGIQVSPDHARVYVALSGSPMGGPNVDESKLPPPDRRYDGIGVVDLKAQKLVTTYQSGADPETFALTHDGKTLYVSNEDSGELSAVDLAQGNVRTHGGGGFRAGRRRGERRRPPGVCRLRDRQQRLRAAGQGHEGAGADPDRQAPARHPAARPGVTAAIVTNEFGGSITVFSTEDYKVLKTIALGDPQSVRPMGIASSDGKTLYVTTGRYGALLEVDAILGTRS